MDTSKSSGFVSPGNFSPKIFRFATVLSLLFATASSHAQDPSVIGQYSAVVSWPFEVTHAHLLPTGKVLWWPPYDQGDNPTLWDPSTNTNTAAPHAGANIF